MSSKKVRKHYGRTRSKGSKHKVLGSSQKKRLWAITKNQRRHEFTDKPVQIIDVKKQLTFEDLSESQDEEKGKKDNNNDSDFIE